MTFAAVLGDRCVGKRDKVAAILLEARRRGVQLWSDNGTLHCRAPKGMLSDADLQYLKAYRAQIIERLEMAIGTELYEQDIRVRPRPAHVPLTYSQLAHWTRYRLAANRHMRQLAHATRLIGPLDLRALRESVKTVVHRHEALRTRIVVIDGIPQQIVLGSSDIQLQVEDLPASKTASCVCDATQWITQCLAERIDVTRDPLFDVRLLREDENQHVLLISMEHIISDGVSRNIVPQEILTAYAQASLGREISLPPVTTQYPDYALWQHEAGRSWIPRRAEFWRRRLAGSPGVQFPPSGITAQENRRGWGTAEVRIPRELKAALEALSRQWRTTLVICVLAAYVALLARWCKQSEVVVEYVTDGRMTRIVESTVGYFAFHLYLRAPVPGDASFAELMSRLTEEYCTAQEYADFGYADAHLPEREFARTSAFNWVSKPSAVGMSRGSQQLSGIVHSNVEFEHPSRP